MRPWWRRHVVARTLRPDQSNYFHIHYYVSASPTLYQPRPVTSPWPVSLPWAPLAARSMPRC